MFRRSQVQSEQVQKVQTHIHTTREISQLSEGKRERPSLSHLESRKQETATNRWVLTARTNDRTYNYSSSSSTEAIFLQSTIIHHPLGPDPVDI